MSAAFASGTGAAEGSAIPPCLDGMDEAALRALKHRINVEIRRRGVRAKWADPEFAAANAERSAERMRKLHAEGLVVQRHLRDMTPEQRANYDKLRHAGHRKAEALAALGLS